MKAATETEPFFGGGYSFDLMIYSNESSNETITFKYFNYLYNTVHCLNETIEWENDMAVGDAHSTYNSESDFIVSFDIYNNWLSAESSFPSSFMINSAYPNPFNPYVNIEYSIIEPSNIDFYFYSLSGELIDEIDAGFLSKGEYSISWEPKNKASGIYFVVMSNGIEKNMTRITLLK